MNLPETLRYTPTHEWVRLEADGTVTVGITDFAQNSLGELVFIELPKPGRQVQAGKECAVVESVKAASDVYAPLSGEVVASNQVLADEPGQVNKNPYGNWLFRINPAATPDLSALLDADAYRKGLA